MRLSFFIATLIFLTSFAPPDPPASSKLRYLVLKDGKEVGEIKAVKTTQGDQVIYDVETHMNIKVLISQKVDYTSKAIYKSGILQSSMAKSYLNDKLHHSCTTALKGSKYEIKRDENNRTLNRTISYSGTMLYFREPGNMNLVYSEMSGQDNAMRKLADGNYMLTDAKSKKQNKYWYKAGILDHAYINHTLIDLEIKRVN